MLAKLDWGLGVGLEGVVSRMGGLYRPDKADKWSQEPSDDAFINKPETNYVILTSK